MEKFLHYYMAAAMCIMVLCVVFCIVRALKGPRITDRVVAMNVIGTIVMIVICLLSYVLDSDFLVDVALLYALLNVLIVVILCRLATVRHKEIKQRKGGENND